MFNQGPHPGSQMYPMYGSDQYLDEESTVHQIGLAVEKLGLGHRGVIRYVLEDDATRLVGLAPMDIQAGLLGLVPWKMRYWPA